MNKKDLDRMLRYQRTHQMLFKNSFVGCFSLDMEMLTIEQHVLDKIGVKASTQEYLTNQMFFSPPNDTPECYAKRISIHESVILSQKAINWVGINTARNNKFQILNYVTKPIFRQNDSTTIGLWTETYHPNLLSAPNLKKLIEPCIDIKSFNFDLNFNPLNLTAREYQIMFLLCNGYSPKEITNILSYKSAKKLSVNTIYHTINQTLVAKFGVFNTAQLINKAILLGYDQNIPVSLLQNSVFEISESSAI